MAKILIVCDDRHMGEWLKETIKGGGFEAETVDMECAATLRAIFAHFDLLVWNNTNECWNHALLRNLLEWGLPVLLTGAPIGVDERMRMLEMGVDDYITRPVHAMELLARIEIALRRRDGVNETVLTVEDVTIKPHENIVTRQGRIVRLTSREYALLMFLLRNRNEVLSRERLMTEVWAVSKREAGETLKNGTRTVDAHIQRIRRKLGLKTSLQTVYRAGYRLVDPDSTV